MCNSRAFVRAAMCVAGENIGFQANIEHCRLLAHSTSCHLTRHGWRLGTIRRGHTV